MIPGPDFRTGDHRFWGLIPGGASSLGVWREALPWWTGYALHVRESWTVFSGLAGVDGEPAMEKVAISPARMMGIIRFGFFLAGVMMIFVAIMIAPQTHVPVDPTIEGIITVLGLGAVFLGFFMPKMLRVSAKREREGQTESAALLRWLRDNLFGLVCIFASNVFAFVLHFLRARAGFVELLFGVGMISLLLWRPETPPVADGESLKQI